MPIPVEHRVIDGLDVDIFHGDIPYGRMRDFSIMPRVAVDIETTGPDRESLLQYDRGSVATVALWAGEEHPSVRPTIVRINPMERPAWLCALLWDSSTQKIFHHAPFDMRFMMHQWQVRIANIACTRMAAKMLGFEPSQRSLQPQVAYFLDVEIPKGEALSDWTLKHLSDNQVRYQLDDVRYLKPLLDAQMNMLRDQHIEDYPALCSFMPTHCWMQTHGVTSTDYYER